MEHGDWASVGRRREGGHCHRTHGHQTCLCEFKILASSSISESKSDALVRLRRVEGRGGPRVAIRSRFVVTLLFLNHLRWFKLYYKASIAIRTIFGAPSRRDQHGKLIHPRCPRIPSYDERNRADITAVTSHRP